VQNKEDFIVDPSKHQDRRTFSSVTEYLKKFSMQQPDEKCAVSETVSFTYKEMNDISDMLADVLSGNRVSGDTVVIFGSRTPYLTVSVLGVIKAGKIFTIIDPKYPVHHIIKRLSYLQSSVCINCGTFDTNTLPFKFETVIDPRKLNDFEKNYYPNQMDYEVDTERAVYVNFTSGTTGVPKAVWGCYNPIGHFIDWQIGQFAITNEDKISVLSGLSHDPIFRDLFLPMTAGACSCYPDDVCFGVPGKLFQWLFDQKISVMHATPSICDLVFTVPDSGKDIRLNSLRYIFSGGEQLSQRMVEKIRRYAPNVIIINCYGATETPQVMAFYCIMKDCLSSSGGLYPVGKGISDVQLLVLNDRNKMCMPGEQGVIYIRTPYRALKIERLDGEGGHNYVENPHNKDNGDLLYKTGDTCFYDDNYNVYFKGRNDRQVKIRGFRIDLSEIECELSKLEYIDTALAVSYDNSKSMQTAIAAFLTLKENLSVETSMVKGALKKRLPDYMVPESLFILDVLPLNANGKVDLESLKNQYLNSEVRKNEGKHHGTLFAILEGTGICFREGVLHGDIDSLMGIELSCKIHNEFHEEIDISRLMSMRTEEDFREFEKYLNNKKMVRQRENSDSSEIKIVEKKVRLLPRSENLFRAILNRILQVIARVAPDVIRVKCHKIRGVNIGKNVSIGYDAIIETSYPYLVKIEDNVNIGMRTTIIGHFRGMNVMDKPTVILEKNAFVGPGVIILPNVTIGRGAVIAAGSVVNSTIPELSFALGNPAKVIARCGVPLTGRITYKEFLSQLKPISNLPAQNM